MKKRVLVALSGGVDSSVAALLLKSRGFEITGVTMRVSEGGEISVADAAKFCNDAGIHHIVLDLEKEFKEIVIGNFIRDYRLGRTPNPCALCNRHFKFGFLLNEAVNNGCDFLATGHYAKIVVDNGRTYIGRAADGGKDQSYFLFGIRPSALERIIFPLGDITKDEVRGIAVDNNLCCLEREESQDICFMSGGDYRDFVRQFLKNGTEQGDIKHVNGRIMGRHNGLYNYTIGQKRGLGLNHHESLYVIRIDRERNELIVGERDDLLVKEFEAENINIFDRLCFDGKTPLDIQLRYRSAPVRGSISITGGDRFAVKLAEAAYGITPGQAVVAYREDRIVGGGWIS